MEVLRDEQSMLGHRDDGADGDDGAKKPVSRVEIGFRGGSHLVSHIAGSPCSFC